MNVVGKVRSLISQSVYSVATPFHPFGGAVDVIVVEQEDGSFRSTPWYVRFGKFQGVLKGAKKIVRISVNGVEASFHMYLDNSGKAYFIREVVSSKDNDKEAVVNESDSLEIIREDNDYYNGDSVSLCRNEINVYNADDVQFSDERVSLITDEIENDEADNERQFCEFQEYQCSCVDSVGSLGYGAFGYDSKGSYLTWEKASPIVLGMAAFGLDLPIEPKDAISVEQDETPKPGEDARGITTTTSSHQWRLWPIPFRTFKTLQHTSSNSSNEHLFLDSESGLQNPRVDSTPMSNAGCESPHKQLVRTNIPTTEQIASLNLKDGQNMITFSFSTRVLGTQQVDADVYLWKWNARVVISDVDGTITKSDVRGQFLPLVGKDWTKSGVAQLFSAIRENGYQLLFLSARAIVQAYLTRSFLLNLKQDGKALPKGPIVISPDGLFSSLYREVIRRAPHEFKIACLEDIKALFPSDYNPFYAGFGNRDTDELSYTKIGIPKGKIFFINPKGKVAISHSIDVKTYMSLHTLVNMFPPTSLVEQEDFNS